MNSTTIINIDIHKACEKTLFGCTGRPKTIQITNNFVQLMKNIYREEKALMVQVVLKCCKVTHPDFIQKYTERKANPMLA
jgi:hypothetical protein